MLKNWISLIIFNNSLDSLRKCSNEFKNVYARKYYSKEFKDEIIFTIPSGKDFDFFKKNKEVFEACIGREFTLEKVSVSCVKFILPKENFIVKFTPIRAKGHELYLAIKGLNTVIIDMNKFPHMLIGGETGTGKSRLLLLALTNLMANNSNVDLYLTQIRKGELSIFSSCRQCKYLARTLEDTRDMLKHINSICIEREKKIEKYLMQGIYNIQDYNKKFKYGLNYIYVVLDEFSFFNVTGADSKEEKIIKKEILSYIKGISMVGRSSGVFLVTSLQKPTSTSIPTDIKSQLCTRVSFKQLDSQASISILGNGNATELKEREVIIRTLEEVKCKVPFIDHDLIMDNIRGVIEENHKFIKLKKDKEIKKETKKEVRKDGVINIGAILNVK